MPPYYQMVFPAWILFYMLGLDGGRFRFRRRKRISSCILIVIASILAEITEAFHQMHNGCSAGFACSQIRVSSFLYSISVIIVLNASESRRFFPEKLANVFSFFGDNSYAIFFVHYFYIMLGKTLISRFSVRLFGICWLPQALIVFFVTVIGSVATIIVLRRILQRLGLGKAIKLIGL